MSLDIFFVMFVFKNLELEDMDLMVNFLDFLQIEFFFQGSLYLDGFSGGSSGNIYDDFVMIDFKLVFFKDDIFLMDLGIFYWEFQNFFQLSSFFIDIGVQFMVEDLDLLLEKLVVYEKNVCEFDVFVEILQ